ncbi:putative gluconokinase [Cladobotryum mycophilum]|uniref:Gluconokinase n=1 Tax=Cladobotryum mycophilum TaxID=491253 RepID=A0ABR0SRQ5_9HYPO
MGDQSEAHASGWIWFVGGPTACGKTTIAKKLSESLNFTYIEGDDYHPKSNVDKMSNGTPLADEDRKEWLQHLHDECCRRLTQGDDHVAVTASLLKRKYRDKVREVSRDSPHSQVRFLFLNAPEEVLLQRARGRHGHFAGANLVHSQLEALEDPGFDETDVIKMDASLSVDDLVGQATRAINSIMKAHS